MTPAQQALLDAADKIEQPEGWMTGNYAFGLKIEYDATGEPVPSSQLFAAVHKQVTEGDFDCFCAVGGIMASTPDPLVLDAACILLAKTIDPGHPASNGRPLSPEYGAISARNRIFQWNDTAYQTPERVAHMMRKAAQ